MPRKTTKRTPEQLAEKSVRDGQHLGYLTEAL